ncbi:MAG: mitofilin family membrane protein [Parvularcula sp.]
MAQNDDQKKDDTPEVDHTDAVDAEIVTDEAEPLTTAAHGGEDGDPEEAPEAVTPPGETGGASNSLVGPFAIIIGALLVVAALIIVLNRNNDAQTRADVDEVEADQPAVVSRPIERTNMPAAELSETDTSNNVATPDADETDVAPAEVIVAEQDDSASDAANDEADAETAAQNALLARAEERAADAIAEEETAIVETVTEGAEEIAEEASVAADKIAAMVEGNTTPLAPSPDTEQDAAEQADAASAPTATEVAAVLDEPLSSDATAIMAGALTADEDEAAANADESGASDDVVVEEVAAETETVEAAVEDHTDLTAPIVTAAQDEAIDVTNDVAAADETLASVSDTLETAHETLETATDESAAAATEITELAQDNAPSSETPLAPGSSALTDGQDAPLIADATPEPSAVVDAPEMAEDGATPADAETIQLAEKTDQPEDSTPPPADSDAIEARIDDITSTVKQDVLAETEQAINQAIGKTEAQVAELRTQLSEQTELQREANEQLASLSSKIETIETSDLSTTKHSTLLLALGDLSEGIDSGRPFSRELDTVENLTPNARELTALHKYSDTGLPTTTELQQAYQEAARNALSGAKRAEADGAMGRFAANLSGLFTVRKIGDVEGDSLSAIIARAEARLESDDLPSALQELEQLDGPGRAAFQEWIDAASAKVDAHRRINALEKSIAASRAG